MALPHEKDCHTVRSVWYVTPRDGRFPLFTRIMPGSSPQHAWEIWLFFWRNHDDDVKRRIRDKAKWVARRFSLTITPYAKD